MQQSRYKFGVQAQKRYRTLIKQALKDIKVNPYRVGSKERNELGEGVRTYHIQFSKSRTISPTVKKPRHLITYKVEGNFIIILGVLHDSMDLDKHLPKEFPEKK